MKGNPLTRVSKAERFGFFVITLMALFGRTTFVTTARADETCSSPYLARVEGQEEFVYLCGTLDLGLVLADVRTLILESTQSAAKARSHQVVGRSPIR